VPTNSGEGANNKLVNDAGESKFSEEDSSTYSDNSEFVAGSRKPQSYTPYSKDYTLEHIGS
jgi:hypothetical protein